MTQNYAIIRHPDELRATVYAQLHGEPEVVPSLEMLDGREGFVISPFHVGGGCPILLLRPDVVETVAVDAVAEACAVCTLAVEGNDELQSAPITNERERYGRAFRAAHAAIASGRMDKVVLSRRQEAELSTATTPVSLFVDACRRYPHLCIALISTSLSGTWLMATPEVLLVSDGAQWRTMALAGTQTFTGHMVSARPQDLQGTVWSSKNRREQQVVADYIRTRLARHADSISAQGPYTTMAAGLLHLRTDISFTLHHTEAIGHVLADLHPTPAVCGLPKEEAMRFILGNEGFDRRYYSGFCGPLSPHGRTALYVSLRCMMLSRGRATLYAGGGLLAESDEEAEWQETKAKLKTMIHIIGNRRF